MPTLKLERFHASADKKAVVQYHPQADSEFAKEQGYVVVRIEDWAFEANPDLAHTIAEVLNALGKDPTLGTGSYEEYQHIKQMWQTALGTK